MSPRFKRISASDVFAPRWAASGHLIDLGFVQEHFAACNHEPKIALSIDRYVIRALAVQFDSLWVNAWINLEIVFQPSLGSVVVHIDAGIHLLVAHSRVIGNVGPPLFRIIAG